MLNNKTIQSIVEDAMLKYSNENCGKKGWTAQDLRCGIEARGGDEADLENAKVYGLMLILDNASRYIN